MLLTKSIPQLCPLTFQLRPALNHEDSLSLLQENFLKTQIGEVFPLPSIISRYNTSLFGFREGKQLAKNYMGTRSPRPPSQCLRVPPGCCLRGTSSRSGGQLGKANFSRAGRRGTHWGEANIKKISRRIIVRNDDECVWQVGGKGWI